MQSALTRIFGTCINLGEREFTQSARHFRLTTHYIQHSQNLAPIHCGESFVRGKKRWGEKHNGINGYLLGKFYRSQMAIAPSEHIDLVKALLLHSESSVGCVHFHGGVGTQASREKVARAALAHENTKVIGFVCQQMYP